MSDTITGMFAGFVRNGAMPLASNDYTHVDVTLRGVQSGGGIFRTRSVMRAGERIDAFTMAGITNPDTPGTMPSCRTSFNGGFCVLYEFEATRAIVEFEGRTRIRFQVFRENAMTTLEHGLFFDSLRITGWTGRGIVRETPAILVPRTSNLEDLAASITGQRSLIDALSDGAEAMITEGTVVETISTWVEHLDYCINPNSRHILMSIAIINMRS